MIIIVGIVAIFLIEKIDFPSPEKKFKIDITNEVNKALNKFTSFLILLSFLLPLKAEEKLIFGVKKKRIRILSKYKNQNKKK